MSEQTMQVPAAVSRRPAASGKLSYSDPVILRDNSRTQIVLVPFFIPRTSGTDLSIKITTYRKMSPPQHWLVVEEKSLSLSEIEARRLLSGLKEHLAVAEEDEDGDYILLKVSDGSAAIGSLDPSHVTGALLSVLSQQEILCHLGESELSEELTTALKASIHLREMRAAVAKLRLLLESGESSEQMYQTWCEEHSWAFGNAYVMRDEVRSISPSDNLDLLLPSVIAGYRDIVELKRPDMNVLNYDDAHRNHYFTADVSKAIGQCHRYLDVLHEAAAQGLRDHPEIVAYHPRSIIVIGRSHNWNNEQLKALHGLNQRLSGITVMTYDQLLAQGERLIDILAPQESISNHEQEYAWPDLAVTDLETFDEDIPF